MQCTVDVLLDQIVAAYQVVDHRISTLATLAQLGEKGVKVGLAMANGGKLLGESAGRLDNEWQRQTRNDPVDQLLLA
ncbi:hypothetical protein D3C85_1561400 [compost metagenome]